MPPDSALAQRLMSKILAEPIATTQPIPLGLMNWKFKVTTVSGSSFIIRFYPRHRSHLINFEPDVIQRCKDYGVLVPEIISDSRTGPSTVWQYSVYRMLPGVSLDSRIDSITPLVMQNIAQTVHQQMMLMAELPLIGHGDLANAGRGHCASWREFILESFAHGLPNAILCEALHADFAKELANLTLQIGRISPPARSVLAWGDVSPANIIVNDNNSVVGLIDFEGALAGEMALNIGYLRARFAGSSFCELIERFWQPVDEERIRADLYAVIRGLRILRYAQVPLPLGKKRDPIEVFLPGFLPAIHRLRVALK